MKSHFLLLPVLAAGCSEGIIVTVEARPAVHDVVKLRVTLAGEGPPVIKDFAVDDDTFPKTFSIGPAGRSGDLLIAIDALGASDIRVGLGSVTTPIDVASASLLLEPADFIVNTEYVGDQLVVHFSATTDETWDVIYTSPTDAQSSTYNIGRRRYDVLGQSVSANAVPAVELPLSYPNSVVATTSAAMIAIHVRSDSEEIWCDGVDVDGNASVLLERGSISRPQIVVRPDNTFAVMWRLQNLNDPFLDDLRIAIVDSKCKFVGSPAATIGATDAFSSNRMMIASGEDLLYMWTDREEAIHLRAAYQTGMESLELIGAGDTLIPPIAGTRVRSMIGAVLDDGFGVLVTRESSIAHMIYHVNHMGVVAGPPLELPVEWADPPVILALPPSIDTFGSIPGSDGNLFIAGTDCGGGDCRVVARLLSSTGDLVSAPFPLATTTGVQYGAYVTWLTDGVMAAAWNDQSLEAPDGSGYAVRARIIYPPGTP